MTATRRIGRFYATLEPTARGGALTAADADTGSDWALHHETRGAYRLTWRSPGVLEVTRGTLVRFGARSPFASDLGVDIDFADAAAPWQQALLDNEILLDPRDRVPGYDWAELEVPVDAAGRVGMPGPDALRAVGLAAWLAIAADLPPLWAALRAYAKRRAARTRRR